MWQGIKNFYHLLNAVVVSAYYGFLSKQVIVIGVTGTDGKTTTVNLIYHILKDAGYSVSMISSINAVINGKQYDTGFHVTTPTSLQIQRFLKMALAAKEATESKRYLVLEVTSHALDQYRVYGIQFAIGVLTNITHEHLDYHKSYKNYVKTKTKLLARSNTVVLNRDDESYDYVNTELKVPSKKNIQKKQKIITYGLNSDSMVNPRSFPFKTNLVGEFNRYNILAAVSAGMALGINKNDIQNGIQSFVLPRGRCDVVHHGAFTVIIDFAHTPNALKNLFTALRPHVKGRIIHVFGSAGERDYKKRPLMGQIAARYADIIILTAEDPRSESVDEIMNQIKEGTRSAKDAIVPLQIYEISDREKAINTAIAMAQKGDLVLLTGKGHEESMNMGKGEEPWSEYEAVAIALKQISRR